MSRIPVTVVTGFLGAGNDLQLTASAAGTAFNNVDIVIEGATGIGNAPTVVYDAGAKRLTITVDDLGATSVGDVVNAINTDGTFTAAHDPSSEGATYNSAAAIAPMLRNLAMAKRPAPVATTVATHQSWRAPR